MKKCELRKLVRECLTELQEANVTGGGASFTSGTGGQYATPFAFSKTQKKHRGIKSLETVGYKQTKRPKRPSHTKLVDYLNN